MKISYWSKCRFQVTVVRNIIPFVTNWYLYMNSDAVFKQWTWTTSNDLKNPHILLLLRCRILNFWKLFLCFTYSLCRSLIGASVFFVWWFFPSLKRQNENFIRFTIYFLFLFRKAVVFERTNRIAVFISSLLFTLCSFLNSVIF